LWVTQSKPSKGLISTIPAPVKCSPHALQGLSEESISTVGEVCFAKKSGIAKITHLVGKKNRKENYGLITKLNLDCHQNHLESFISPQILASSLPYAQNLLIWDPAMCILNDFSK
jgi:hypothetical protein